MQPIVSPIGRGQGHEFLNKLEAAGFTDELAQRVIDSKGNDLAAKVVRLIENGGFEATTSQKRAREIMGRNMFGVEDAIRHFGVIPMRHQTAVLSEIPWSVETLEECRETHILVAVFPLSILDIRGKFVSQVNRLFYNQDWYVKQALAKEKGEAEWKLVKKTPVENSTGKTWEEQQALLGVNEETPTVRVVVYATIGHFLSTAERLFERVYVRCSDVVSVGYRVRVGDFDSGGLHVDSGLWGDGRDGALGVSAARKPE